MRVFWEKIGVLGPIYRLVGQGWNDRDIAVELKLTERQVHSCVCWMLLFFKMSTRLELILDAASPSHAAPRIKSSERFEFLHNELADSSPRGFIFKPIGRLQDFS